MQATLQAASLEQQQIEFFLFLVGILKFLSSILFASDAPASGT